MLEEIASFDDFAAAVVEVVDATLAVHRWDLPRHAVYWAADDSGVEDNNYCNPSSNIDYHLRCVLDCKACSVSSSEGYCMEKINKAS